MSNYEGTYKIICSSIICRMGFKHRKSIISKSKIPESSRKKAGLM